MKYVRVSFSLNFAAFSFYDRFSFATDFRLKHIILRQNSLRHTFFCDTFSSTTNLFLRRTLSVRINHDNSTNNERLFV